MKEDGLLIDIRQRLINIETKINELRTRVPDPNAYQGSPEQRYGHLSYSQHGEDLLFLAIFEQFGVLSPNYLDIGANDPIGCSNTALLYSRGARGVNIDASPDVIGKFNEARPDDLNLNIGVGGAPGTMTFFRAEPTGGRNSFKRETMVSANIPILDEIEVPVLTLDDVIEKYCHGKCPDLVSIDAEGLDYEILEAASFSTRPHILCVETLSAVGDIGGAIDALLAKKGFRKCVQMFANGIYIDKDRTF